MIGYELDCKLDKEFEKQFSTVETPVSPISNDDEIPF